MELWISAENVFARLAVGFVVVMASSIGMAQALPANAPQGSAPQAFDVVTIKPSKTTVGGMGLGRSSPDGISLINASAISMIANAYSIKPDLVTSAPGWAHNAEFDVEAKVLPSAEAPAPHLTVAQIKTMIRAMLADRFKLQVHEATAVQPVYELSIAKGGVKLREAIPGDTYANGIKGPDGRSGPGMMIMQNGKFYGQAVRIGALVDTLSVVLHRIVVDKTGLTGKYDIEIALPKNDDLPAADMGAPDMGEASFFTTFEEQTGLKLRGTKGEVRMIVIDHIERPAPN